MQPSLVNRKARFDYQILETFEVGIELVGTEVKSVRAGKISLRDAFARIRRGEVYLYGAEISPYENAGYARHDPTRPRRLLMHGREIGRLVGKVSERGLTLIPLKVYFKRGWAKVQLGLAKARKKYDKRETLRKKEEQKDIARALARRR